jgi:hypothetical protein
MHITFLSKYMKGRDYLEDVGVDEKIILKLILKVETA